MSREIILKGASVGCALLMVLMGVSMLAGADKDGDKVRVIVLFKDKVDTKLIEDNNGDVLDTFTLIPGAVAEMTKSDIKALKKSDKVKAVEADAEATILGAKDEDADKEGKGAAGKPAPAPSQTLAWGVDRIDADKVWASTDSTTGNGIKVAVLDTGIDKDHPDLNVAGGVNFIAVRNKIDSNAWDDDNGHGTHCAGIIAAQHNTIGVMGVAPNVNLYAVKVLNKLGNGWYSDFIKGLSWAVTNNMQVVSMSFGGSTNDPALETACDAAQEAGIVLVAAAGNTGTETVLYPAKYDSVLAVSSTDSSDKIASTSAYGPEIDMAAPGVNIYSTYKGGTYTTMSGTSMACPHVAGVAALVWGKDKSQSNDGVIAALLDNGEDLGTTDWDKYYGFGLVDAENAYGPV